MRLSKAQRFLPSMPNPSFRSSYIHTKAFNTSQTDPPHLASMCQTLVQAKQKKSMTFAEIANGIGRSEVWTAALFYGQAKPEKHDIDALSRTLEIPQIDLQNAFPDSFFPTRGVGQQLPPTDPLIYRLYEIILVYGYPLKSIIHEKFGDGIMSAVDFTCNVKKIKEDQADRVQITLNGKWLPFKRW